MSDINPNYVETIREESITQWDGEQWVCKIIKGETVQIFYLGDDGEWHA